jgi:hypothetical protein
MERLVELHGKVDKDAYGAVTQIRKGRFSRPFSAVSWVTTLSNP